MSESCKANRKSLQNKQKIPAEAQRASYEVTQAKKPHTIGEKLNKPTAVAISRAMHDGDKSARELESVPLSNGTIARRITDMAQDITCQLVDRVKKGKYAFQLDESTDILNSAQLLVFIRYSSDGKRNAVLLRAPRSGVDVHRWGHFYKTKRRGTIFGKNCIGVCQDRTGAMLGEKKGLIARVLQMAPRVNFTHCFIHRESLARETLEPELKLILDIALKMVNYIKTCPLTIRLALAEKCAEPPVWAAGGGAHICVYGSQLADHLTDPDWLTRLGYLCEETCSALTNIKNKYRTQLNVENDLRVTVSKTKPRMDLLCSMHVAHLSH